MTIERLVDIREGLDINRNTTPIITLRDKYMEEAHPRDRHTSGPPLDPIYLYSWILSHNITMKMILRIILSSTAESIMP
jgi:hypothetical protein